MLNMLPHLEASPPFLFSLDDQPLTDPIMIPCTKYFCTNG